MVTFIAQLVFAAQPKVYVVPATRITFNDANLNTIVNPGGLVTTVTFEYGITTGYGSTINLGKTINGNVKLFNSVRLTGLTAGKTYHFRVKAVNSSGTVFSKDRIFVTGSNFFESGQALHTLIVGDNGLVYATGSNTQGQLGDGSKVNSQVFKKVLMGLYDGTKFIGDNKNNPVISVCSSWESSYALTADGLVYSWGHNQYGQLGDNTTTNASTPVKVLKGDYLGTTYLGDNPDNPIIAIAAGKMFAVALAFDGRVYCFGQTEFGQLGDNKVTVKLIPSLVVMGEYPGSEFLGDNKNNPIVDISSTYNHTVCLSAEGRVYSFGCNYTGEFGDSIINTSTFFPKSAKKGDYSGQRFLGDDLNNPIIAISTGGTNSIFMSSSGEVFCAGDNRFGQLGNGNNVNSTLPVKVLKGDYTGTRFLGDNSSNPPVSVTSSAQYHRVLCTDGMVYSFGNNEAAGSLGINNQVNSNLPKLCLRGAYSGTTYLGDNKTLPIIAISSNQLANFSLTPDGTLFAVGQNESGQIGDNSKIMRLIPVKVWGEAGIGILDIITGTPMNNIYSMESDLSIYPNPTNDFLLIKNLQIHENKQYRMIDCMGKVVKDGVVSNEDKIIRVSNLEVGIYFLELEGISKPITVFKSN